MGNDVLLYLTITRWRRRQRRAHRRDDDRRHHRAGSHQRAEHGLDEEYDFFVPCLGNTDVTAASSTSGPGRMKTALTNASSGFSAKLQQAVIGVTGALAAAKTGTSQHNFAQFEYIFCNAGQSLPCEFAGAEAGARLREEAADPNVNRIGTGYRATLYGARDLVASTLSDPSVEDALQHGVTPLKYDSSNALLLSRPITTYWKDTLGNADSRILDVGRVSGIFAVANDVAVALPQEFPQRKLSDDLPAGEDELPEGVTEVRDVKAFIISRLRFWQKRGVVRKDKLDAAIADGTLIVRVNPTDASQCDVVLPARDRSGAREVLRRRAEGRVSARRERIDEPWPTMN
jgi:phage tail sheath gpL-like